ncbi:MAG: T9SS type A sorting domain-containing protein [Lutibacter sp.]|nr:T9SS type A sorting domain-containing protein [Lutibacter sp.]
MVKNYPVLKNLAALFFLLFAFSAFSQTQTFTNPLNNGLPANTFTVPAGVTQVTVEAWGGGGAGGSSKIDRYSAGGGGGGAYTIANSVSVTSGQTYAVTIGSGGIQNFGANGGDGGNSTFLAVNANGGKGGGGVTTYIVGLSGAGGTGGTYSGGSGMGGNFSNSGASGGGGGGSAGTASDGNDATTQIGATAKIGGGNGGNGGNKNSFGYAPTVNPGGGGGGSGDASGAYMFAGGAGGNGQIRITWTCPTYSLSSTSVITPICINNGAVVTLNAAPINLPIGTYTVTYNQSVNNVVTGATKTMTVTTPGTGSFTTNNLANPGATTITITNLSSGSGTSNCSYAINANNVAIVTVNPLPVAAGTITGTPTVCQGQNTVAYSVPAITNATSYTWAYSGTGATISGTSNNITINFAANATSGNLTVRGTNACGNGTVSANYAVTVNTQPIAPTVGTITQPTCSTATGSVVLNGLPATGSWTINPGTTTGTGTSTTISGLATGTYNFTVTSAAGCTSSASANVDINSQPSINIWNGSVSTDWKTAGNWCTGVPSVTNNKDVLIPTIPTGGRYPILNAFMDPTYPEGYVKNIVFESGTTLIIVNNTLFVEGNLTLNGKIDLNNEAQLVQDTGSTFDPLSTGTIEIDQQGTSDNFKYNYWGSPVNTTGTSYTIAGVLRDGTDPNAFPLTPITFGAPYTFADGTAPLVGEAIKLSTYWMYKYANLGNGYSGWTSVGKDGNLNVGEGFTMKGSNTGLIEQNYTFVGKPNNGDITLLIAANRDYLIGNPYPSAIDAKEFIRDNISVPSGYRAVNVIDGNLYFWDHFGGGNHLLKSYEGGYGIFNLTGFVKAMATDALINNTGNQSTKIPPRFIPVAQGFFVTSVSGIVGTENIQFKNSQRLYKKEEPSVSQFMKSEGTAKLKKKTVSEEVFPKIYLKYSSAKGFHRQLLVGFIENTTDGVDIGYDAINYETFAEDMSWRNNNINFIIQAVPTLNDERKLPLEVKVATTGIIKISIDNTENIPEDTEIFMEDSTTGKRHNISKNQFEIELAAGKYTDRFALTFKTQKLIAEDVMAEVLIPAATQPTIEGIHVFMNNAIGELQIKNNSAEEILNIALINSLGQTIKTWNSNFNIRTISLPVSTATGVYLVQINTKTGNTVKKISVNAP